MLDKIINKLMTRWSLMIQAAVISVLVTSANINKFNLDWFTFLSPLILLILIMFMLELTAVKEVERLSNSIKKLKGN